MVWIPFHLGFNYPIYRSKVVDTLTVFHRTRLYLQLVFSGLEGQGSNVRCELAQAFPSSVLFPHLHLELPCSRISNIHVTPLL